MDAEMRDANSNPDQPNGRGAAALLSAGIGSFALAVIAILSDRIPAFSKFMNAYKPTGPLSGVSALAILVWCAAWILLDLRWRRRNVRLKGISVAAMLLLLAGFLLMFPPLADLF